MREGRLLAENSPTNILTIYEANSIEEAFLKLCTESKLSNKENKFLENHSNYIINDDDEFLSMASAHNNNNIVNIRNMQNSDNQRVNVKMHRKMKALLIKNLISIIRRPM